MAWESRGSNRYYYQKRRTAGKVSSVYMGRGLDAQEIAMADFERRSQKMWQAKILRSDSEKFGLIDREVKEASSMVKQAVGSYLLSAGFHNHKGQWRRRRVT